MCRSSFLGRLAVSSISPCVEMAGLLHCKSRVGVRSGNMFPANGPMLCGLQGRNRMYSIVSASNTSCSSNVVWFTREEQDVFDAETIEFDDSTPTLPMLLVKARTAKRSQTTGKRGSSRKEVIGKNKRIKLIRNENDVHVPTIDEGIAPAALETKPLQADKFVSRG